MSNIYIIEPPTHGKILLKTTVGDIDIELWSKEAPKACRNFVQLCLEGYYNGTIFHRVVKGFIVQGGDPTGTGTGGDSVYGQTFKDEFHSRLRFSRRGLLAMANAGRDDNASQFFFTLAATPELQNKHTIFGKVSGETLFNMLKLEDAMVDHDERPTYPQKVTRTEVLFNPFPDIVTRVLPPTSEQKSSPERNKKKEKKSGVKNFKLLSFGSEAEEDEEETEVANKKYTGRSKSTHDLLQDPTLSAEHAVDDVPEDYVNQNDVADSEQMERIRKKLKADKTKLDVLVPAMEEQTEDAEEEGPYVLGQARKEERQKQAENIRKEIRDLKRGYQSDKKKKEEEVADKEKEIKGKGTAKSEVLEEYEKDQEKYKKLKSELKKKGPSREEFTLALLAKFQKKLSAAKEKSEEEPVAEKTEAAEGSDEEDWLTHKLHFEDVGPKLAKDASTKGDDWFDITDPRNPINKRRREAHKAGPSKRDSR